MSADYLMNGPEGRRAHALDEALRNLPLEVNTHEVVARAKEFEKYLKGGPEPITMAAGSPVSMQLRPKPENEPLPEPPHTPLDRSGPGVVCLGCEWRKLRARVQKAEATAHE